MPTGRFPFRTYGYTSTYTFIDVYVGITAGFTTNSTIDGLLALYGVDIGVANTGTDKLLVGSVGVLYDTMGYLGPWERPEEATLQCSSDGGISYPPIPGFTVQIGGVTGTFTEIKTFSLDTRGPSTLEFPSPIIRAVQTHYSDGTFTALVLKLPSISTPTFSLSFNFGYTQTGIQGT